MGIKTKKIWACASSISALKNLPTTWGLRRLVFRLILQSLRTLKNLPTTWGLRQGIFDLGEFFTYSVPTTRVSWQGKKRPSENIFQTAFFALPFIG